MNLLHRRRLLLFFICTVFFRLFLSADRDILALNQPYDDYWFVLTAQRWIWGHGYNHMAFAQLPLYSIWLKAVSLFGIPARLAIDVAWLFACAYLGIAIARLCKQIWPGVLLYLFLVFHPFSIAWFDRALSENLMTVLLTFGLAGFIEIWNLKETEVGWRRTLAAVVASLAFALAFHMRKESVVLLPPIIGLVIWSLFHRDAWWVGRQRVLIGYPMIVYPLAIALILGVLLASANYVRWGVFSRYELAAPGYVRAVNSLNAIDPGTTTPKYVTVTALTRAKAYAVSPTFSELKPFFEGASGQAVSEASSAFTSGVRGEIANGWFYWALRDAAAMAGWHDNAVKAEEKYNDMSKELEKAFRDGRLKKRHVLLSFIDPDWHKWLPDFPRAFIAENRLIVDLRDTNLQPDLQENATPAQFDNFLAIAGRRNPPPPKLASLAGWLILPEGSEIGFGTPGQTYAWQNLSGPARPDVPGGLPFILTSKSGEVPTELHVRRPDGQQGRLVLDSLKLGTVRALDGMPEAKLGIDRLTSVKNNFRANALLPIASKIWSYLGWLFVAAGTLALLLFRLKNRMPIGAASLVALLALTAIFARTGLLAVLDASAWKATEQARYIFPVVPFLAVFGILGLWMLVICFLPAKRS